MIRSAQEQAEHDFIESYVAPLREEIKTLKEQIKKLNVKDCSSCDGTGTIFTFSRLNNECYICKGTGKVELIKDL